MTLRFQGRIIPTGKIKVITVAADVPPVIITNPQPPVWVTGSGYITAFAEGEAVDYPLIASDPNDDIVSYEYVSGTFPPGLSLNLFSGRLAGTVGSVLQDTRYTFSVKVTDSLGLSATRSFEILIVNEATVVTWNTPSGELADVAPGQIITAQLGATSS